MYKVQFHTFLNSVLLSIATSYSILLTYCFCYITLSLLSVKYTLLSVISYNNLFNYTLICNYLKLICILYILCRLKKQILQSVNFTNRYEIYTFKYNDIYRLNYEIYRFMCKEEGTFYSVLAHKFRGCLNLWTIPLYYHVQVHLK